MNIQECLAACGMRGKVRRESSLGGGFQAEVRLIELDHGEVIVGKFSLLGDRLVEEENGLRLLRATNTVAVPEVLGATTGALFLEYVAASPLGTDEWSRFGQALAALHGTDVGPTYGLDHDNHLGATLQPNTPSADWARFNQTCRFGPLRAQLGALGLVEGAECSVLDRLIATLPDILPAAPKPALLHGDLWNGNALGSGRGVVLIDPAVSKGDGLADVAMMQLFGGFPAAVFDAYAETANVDLSAPEALQRLAVYMLYHVLNHWLLFGRGYASQAIALTRDVLSRCERQSRP